MKETQPVISINNISKKYVRNNLNEPFWALKNVSFNVGKGEIVGIIGRNGAGKSTILRILSDVIAPTEGKIKYEGLAASILDIGTGFHPDLSGYDNIFLNASLFGMTKKDVHEKLEAIIEFSGIRSFIHEPVRIYSNGMYLRLAFSIAAHLNTQILLLDEVVAVGDNEFKEKCMSKLRELSRSGLTILMVSHNMSQVLELCSRAIWIDNGEVKGDGEPIEVIENYIEGFSIKKENPNDQPITLLEKKIDKMVNDFVYLDKITVSSGADRGLWPLHINEPIKIVFHCQKMVAESALELALHITNLDGIRIFLDSFALRSRYNYDMVDKEGKYEISCVIPADFLPRGIYHLSLIVSKSFELQDQLENILTFKILPSTEVTGVEDNFNQMNTVVSPRLQWEIVRL